MGNLLFPVLLQYGCLVPVIELAAFVLSKLDTISIVGRVWRDTTIPLYSRLHRFDLYPAPFEGDQELRSWKRFRSVARERTVM